MTASVLTTTLKRRERHITDELVFTLHGPSSDGNELPIEAQTIGSVIEATDSRTTEQNQRYEFFESNLSPIAEESLIELLTRDPEVIDRLKAEVIAMLEPAPSESTSSPVAITSPTSTSADSTAESTADSASDISSDTEASSPPFTLPEPSSPVLIFDFEPDLPIQSPPMPPPEAKDENLDYRPDSAVAFIHSPIIYPGSTPRASHPKTSKIVTYRPSRIALDEVERSAIEDLSRSLDFDTRPLSVMKRVLRKMGAGNRKVYQGVKSAGPRVLRMKRSRVGGDDGDQGRVEGAERDRRYSA
ncbi:hypothetical protein BU23DRAFT_557276 [Bimuria novae-zelandiae CBS 107.79]|uniref:Uncharacterized protein n=1 Tax=Bimuria novae-zelandiae CBS 107.79 TaxID=1447943 RepID=A0A6A5V977_9PLEO|nr:hypothetical protein BU23DRAFT_557276 [Bimuria novae-zelandiae CBS 107.79]